MSRSATVIKMAWVILGGFLIGYFSAVNPYGKDLFFEPSPSDLQSQQSVQSAQNLQEAQNSPCECEISKPAKERHLQERLSAAEASSDAPNVKSVFQSPTTVQRLFNCTDFGPPGPPELEQRGDYYILHNVITAQKSYRCDETLTFATHGDISFIGNLVPLLDRWTGPISLVLWVPGSDYVDAIDVIKYFRDCTQWSDRLRDQVTFHFAFHREHISEFYPTYKWEKVNAVPFECPLQTNEVLYLNPNQLYSQNHKIPYPSNLLRNIARDGVRTAMALYADLGYFPSMNLIPQFLQFLRKNPKFVVDQVISTRNAFVLMTYAFRPVLTYKEAQNQEKSAYAEIPLTKMKLSELVHIGQVVQWTNCTLCASGLKSFEEWASSVDDGGLDVYLTVKRMDPDWAPFYIGPRHVPDWDDRLVLDQKDRIAQASVMCLMDYDFHVLNNAFLIRYRKGEKLRPVPKIPWEVTKVLTDEIEPEMSALYGERVECYNKPVMPKKKVLTKPKPAAKKVKSPSVPVKSKPKPAPQKPKPKSKTT